MEDGLFISHRGSWLVKSSFSSQLLKKDQTPNSEHVLGMVQMVVWLCS